MWKDMVQRLEVIVLMLKEMLQRLRAIIRMLKEGRQQLRLIVLTLKEEARLHRGGSSMFKANTMRLTHQVNTHILLVVELMTATEKIFTQLTGKVMLNMLET